MFFSWTIFNSPPRFCFLCDVVCVWYRVLFCVLVTYVLFVTYFYPSLFTCCSAWTRFKWCRLRKVSILSQVFYWYWIDHALGTIHILRFSRWRYNCFNKTISQRLLFEQIFAWDDDWTQSYMAEQGRVAWDGFEGGAVVCGYAATNSSKVGYDTINFPRNLCCQDGIQVCDTKVKALAVPSPTSILL